MHTIDIGDQVYEAVEVQARLRGISINQYVETVLSEHSRSNANAVLSPEEIRDQLEKIERFRQKQSRPVNGHVDYSRDLIYP